MEQNKLIKKINFIMRSFIDNDAQLWNIGTNVYHSWFRIANNIKSIDFKEDDFFEIKQVEKNRFQFLINNKNANPIIKKCDVAARSTLRQYMQEGSAFCFVDFTKDHKIIDGAKFKILPELFNLKNNPEETLLNQIIFLLKNSYNHEISFCKNLGFSLFISLIYRVDKNLFYMMENFSLKSIKAIKKLGHPTKNFYLHDENVIKYFGRIYGDLPSAEGYGDPCGNYVTCIEKLIDEYSFEDIINSIYNKTINIDNDEINLVKMKDKNNDTTISFIKSLSENRSKLRSNIIECRVKDIGDSYYCDITNSPLNNTRVEYMDACHIYEVKCIEHDLMNEINDNQNSEHNPVFQKILNRYIDFVQNPNNGILLSKCCHALFDKQIVWFNTNGKLRYREECKDIVEKYFGKELEKIQIRQNILNENMKFYLSKRYSINQNDKK